MDYLKIYNDLIEKRKTDSVETDCHSHHIIPKSLGGSNDSGNLVNLTYREHLIAHKLLIKIHVGKNKSKMVYALWKMVISYRTISIFKVTSRTYESSRILFALMNPNKDEKRKRRYKENHKAGKYNHDYNKTSNTLANTLANMSKEDMAIRIKNSFLSCDQEKRAQAIREGKASIIKIKFVDGIEQIVKSTEIEQIVNISWGKVKYLCKHYDGFDKNTGIIYDIIQKYTGGNKWKNSK